ncbi:MAG: hypothetical protein GF398_18720 [Chitinivibrionales bacterium]|nr:hypothetical protein [Chitinivibrionales bacterium]
MLIGLIAVYVAIRTLSKNAGPMRYLQQAGDEFDRVMDLRGLDSLNVADVQKQLAGFWCFDSPVEPHTTIWEHDRLELKENGIIWQVRRTCVRLPDNTVDTTTYVNHRYLQPKSYYAGSPNTYLCDGKIIDHVWLTYADTCYAPQPVHFIKEQSARGADSIVTREENFSRELTLANDTLYFENRIYTPYPDSSLDNFFPANVLEYIEKFTVPRCDKLSGLLAIVNNRLRRSFAQINVDVREREAVFDVIARYYAPLMHSCLLDRDDVETRKMPDSLSFSAEITREGTLTDIELHGENFLTVYFHDVVLETMRQWQLPRLKAQREPESFAFTVALKSRLAGR